MNRAAEHDFREDSATVVTSQRVRPGRSDEYQRWQEKTNRIARRFDGFEGTELYPPDSPDENEWVVVFRFSHLDQLTAWLDSGARRELLDEARPLFESTPTQEVLAGGTPVRQEVITAVVSHEVRPEREREFVRWQEKVLKAQQAFPGFMGSEMFRPVPGVQNNWVVAFRFDTREHLDAWLESDVRKGLLEEGHQIFESYDVHKVGSAFSGWFDFEHGREEGVPPNWKQAMTVVLALYPTVMMLNWTVGFGLSDLGVPGYIGLFVGNVLSVSILTWFLMPLVNRVFSFWLSPARARTRRIHVLGALAVAACYLVSIVVFGLTIG
ncbi:antibiotic biosynthesis monooxygenase [Streptomyces pathocidini]|uniref:Antibiotic biosynthesis monooxygenase n=1 Tax=Streptomyces pathocidini TaxID=1650571 RepID=A0ABW7UKZ9_9ACTN|nr:antibiotic biosynthesis monooxygenase [Streptomyces pathocidini]